MIRQKRAVFLLLFGAPATACAHFEQFIPIVGCAAAIVTLGLLIVSRSLLKSFIKGYLMGCVALLVGIVIQEAAGPDTADSFVLACILFMAAWAVGFTLLLSPAAVVLRTQ